MTKEPRIHYCFVDESGDLTLFDKKGRVVVGEPGASRFFMVGVASIPDPQKAHKSLNSLRTKLLADPYFKDVPSMRLSARKTALYFHAKDDLPEVRREVFKILPKLGVKVQIAIRRKHILARQAKLLLQKAGRKLRGDEIYDDLVKRLLKSMLHKADENRIVFARRGKSARAEALRKNISRAKANFEVKWGLPSNKPTTVHSGFPQDYAGLQVIDYYLWALQRMFERGEDRFFFLLNEGFRLIMDLDDTRNKPYGEWYSDANPLILKKILPSNRLGSDG